MIHVYCLRGQEYEVKKWMKDNGLSEDIIQPVEL
jgi:hypothetical protein